MDRTTLTYDEFREVPMSIPQGDLRARVQETLQASIYENIEEFYNNESLQEIDGEDVSGYSLCLVMEDIKDIALYPQFIAGVSFEKQKSIVERDVSFFERHHDYFKRGDETLDETIMRLQNMMDRGGTLYTVRDANNTIIGSMALHDDGQTAALFSFYVEPEWRSKGVAKMMIQNVSEDIRDVYKFLFFKTKNKFMYYFLTRYYDATLLRKEVYKKQD